MRGDELMMQGTALATEHSGVPPFCRALVDGSPMGVAFVAGDAHRIRYVNEPFCVLLGRPAGALVGEPFAGVAPAGEECLALLERVHRTGLAEIHTGVDGSPFALLYWSYVMWPVLAPDGSRTGIMIQITESTSAHTQATAMNQALMIGSIRQHELTEAAEALNSQLKEEILQRAFAEAALQSGQVELSASEGRYRGLIEAIPQIVWIATPEGSLDFANSKWFEHLGKDLSAFNREGWGDLIHPDDSERFLDAWRTGLKGDAPFQIEHRASDAVSGAFRWFLLRAVPIRAEHGPVVRWFGTNTDVDDNKRAELALFNKQKLESLGVLAGGIAHDFNNLLCTILGGASLLASALPESDRMRATLADIVHASERGAHLTRQMLAYAGKGHFVLQQVDVAELVRSTASLIRTSVPGNVELILDLDANLPPVEADSGQIQQVIMNLVLNAAEAIDASVAGQVRVKTAVEEISARKPHKGGAPSRNLPPGSYVVLEVRDNGSGMKPETLAKIFDPFFTTKFTGRGLGLAAVQGIMRSRGGAVDVQSVVGAGTTFGVFLPVSLRAREPAIAAPAAVRISGEHTVLVVDDDAMVRRVAAISLRNAGFIVRPVGGGEEAMRILLSEPASLPSIVVLDLQMPGMSGKQVMERMKMSNVRVPVLIMSGYSESQVLGELSGLDIAAFVQKPFTPRQLADSVGRVLSETSATGRLPKI